MFPLIRSFPASLILLYLAIITITGGIASAAGTWEEVSSPSWVTVAIPPGWSLPGEPEISNEEDSVLITSISPDQRSELTYILNHTDEDMPKGQMQAFQNQWMKDAGYRICQTKEPVIRTKADYTSVKQVFVQGTDRGAVMYSASYPGWGQYHAALLMTGSSAVSQYYDSLPPQIPDHIIPVTETEDTGTITFAPETEDQE